jgi:hypothetical protein
MERQGRQEVLRQSIQGIRSMRSQTLQIRQRTTFPVKAICDTRLTKLVQSTLADGV